MTVSVGSIGNALRGGSEVGGGKGAAHGVALLGGGVNAMPKCSSRARRMPLAHMSPPPAKSPSRFTGGMVWMAHAPNG